MILKSPSLHGSERFVAKKEHRFKEICALVCIQALLELYAEILRSQKRPTGDHHQGRMCPEVLSTSGQGSVIAVEQPVGSSRSKCMRRTKGSESWPYGVGDCHKVSVQFSCSVVSNSLQPHESSTPGLPLHHTLPESQGKVPLNNSETQGHKECRNLRCCVAGDWNPSRDTSEQMCH